MLFVAVEIAAVVERGICAFATPPERRPCIGGAVFEQSRETGLGVAHDHIDSEQVARSEVEQARLGAQRGFLGAHRLREGGGGHLAQSFDVERTARPDVLDATAHLSRARPGVRAAQVDVALLRGGER